jgi:tetratricopeptide (TPR) repeat protein
MTRRAAVLSLVLLLGCKFGSHRDAGKRGNPDEALARLDAADAVASKGPAERARAGWLRYLVASDPRGAALNLEAAAQSNDGPQRALALCALGDIAEDLTDSVTATQDFALALRVAPRDPVAELAAVRLLDEEGDSPAVDDLIVGAAASLSTPMAPRAARLVREAAARIESRRTQTQKAGTGSSEVEAWRKMGAIQHWRVAGPFGALRLFDLRRPLALDTDATRTAADNARSLDVPDGDVGLELEPSDGDVFYAASEVTLQQGGEYLLWVEGAAALEARIDGVAVLSRVPYPQEVPRAQSLPVKLAKGKHALLVRWSRAEGSRFRLSLVRGDGGPSDATSAAPESLTSSRQSGPCALGSTCTAKPAWKDKADLRAAAEAQLADDDGDPLAAYLFVRAVLGDDRAAARAGVDEVIRLSSSGAPALSLRAQELLHDPDVPDRIARGRALADLSEAARKDPRMVRARLGASALLRDSERYDDAASGLDKAEATLREAGLPATARTLMSRARLFDARGNPAGARARAKEALQLAPGRCETLQLLYDLARRDGSAEEQQKLAQDLLPCNDGLRSLANLSRERGELARAEELFALGTRLRPAVPQRFELLSEVQAARKRLPDAIASMKTAAGLSPRSAEPWRRLASLYELSGDGKAAAESRQTALRLSPGDLPLRQQVWLDRGEKLLAWSDRDGRAAARQPMPNVPKGTSSVLLLDQGAAEIFEDRGVVERVHTVTRVLDKKGVSRAGEAQIPQDAQVLQLRTLKKDGRVLEPESIPEKEGVSLPGLEPGDAVEIDYLRGIPPRGPDLPGLTLGGFYFRDDDTAMGESSYEVRAPMPLEVDAHNMTLPPGALQGGRFRHTVHDVAPATPEPHQPGESETMPWVQVGTGAGQKELVRSIADWALIRTRPTSATLDLARRNAGVSVRETVKNIYAAVAEAVRGRSTGSEFGTSAPHVLLQGRGNRLVLLKSTLAAAQIPSHIVLTRTVTSDPATYRFPRAEQFGYAVLRVDLPDGPVWIDPSYRLAPLGQLPTFVRGMEAWVVPEPGEEPVAIKVPQSLPDERDGRSLSLELTLDQNGDASGTGRDEHFGFEAASLKDALERLDRDQRKQGVESMLGRGLHGVTLETLNSEHENELGGPAALIYTLKTPLARKDGARLFVPQSVAPGRLVRRWVQLAERTLPLLLDSPEQMTTHVAVTLPKGMHLRPGFKPARISTRFGRYTFDAREEGGTLVMDETLEVPAQRVAPSAYAEFVKFATAVDDAQSSELVVEARAVSER